MVENCSWLFVRRERCGVGKIFKICKMAWRFLKIFKQSAIPSLTCEVSAYVLTATFECYSSFTSKVLLRKIPVLSIFSTFWLDIKLKFTLEIPLDKWDWLVTSSTWLQDFVRNNFWSLNYTLSMISMCWCHLSFPFVNRYHWRFQRVRMCTPHIPRAIYEPCL